MGEIGRSAVGGAASGIAASLVGEAVSGDVAVAVACAITAAAAFAIYRAIRVGRRCKRKSRRAIARFPEDKALAVIAALHSVEPIPIEGFEFAVGKSVGSGEGIFDIWVNDATDIIMMFGIDDDWRRLLSKKRNLKLLEKRAGLR